MAACWWACLAQGNICSTRHAHSVQSGTVEAKHTAVPAVCSCHDKNMPIPDNTCLKDRWIVSAPQVRPEDVHDTEHAAVGLDRLDREVIASRVANLIGVLPADLALQADKRCIESALLPHADLDASLQHPMQSHREPAALYCQLMHSNCGSTVYDLLVQHVIRVSCMLMTLHGNQQECMQVLGIPNSPCHDASASPALA